MRSVEVLGCRVHDVTMEEALACVESFVASGAPHQQVSVNVDKVVQAARDAALRALINRTSLSCADGMPIVWAARLLGDPLRERVAGIDLFEALLARAAEKGWGVYLLGAEESVVACARERYEKRYPALRIVGHRNGYWRPEEEPAVAEAIREARPDILFVALGSPAKERFLERWQPHMRVPFAMGVGGSFDVAAGRTRRAPRWMQRAGFEWFYRFLQEPRRMFPRYFVRDMAFFAMLARELFRRWLRALVAIVSALALAATCFMDFEA